MKARGHLMAALPLGAALYAASGSAPATLGGMALSVFLDVDHLPDYIWWRRGRISPADFFRTNYKRQVPTLVLPLHAWELLVPGTAALLWALGPVWGGCLAAGWAYHLVWDQIKNPVNGLFYFFCYRAAKGFERRLLQPWLYQGQDGPGR